MKRVSLNADIRENKGKHQSKKLSRQEMVPAILYGETPDGTLLKVNEHELNYLLTKNGENVVVELKIGEREVPAVIKEVQRHPVDRTLIHVDFQPVTLHEVIHADVPIVLANSERVEKNGWIINKQMLQVEVEGDVESIPSSITLDAAKYKPGDVVKVSDVEISQELSIVNNGNEVIFSIIPYKEKPIDLVFDRVEPEIVKDEPSK